MKALIFGGGGEGSFGAAVHLERAACGSNDLRSITRGAAYIVVLSYLHASSNSMLRLPTRGGGDAVVSRQVHGGSQA